MKLILISLILLAFSLSVSAQQTCSRTALINFQEVLVDTSTSQKGEGLRYHLEKDPIALSYLDKYQDGSKMHLENTILGTTGSLLIISGIFTSSSNGNNKRLMLGGISLLLANFLIAKTLDNKNEKYLNRAVDEYNKRNTPRIFFPATDGRSGQFQIERAFSIAKSWSF